MGSSKSSNTTTTQTVTTTQTNNASITQVSSGLNAEGIIGIINAMGANLTGQQAANASALSSYFSNTGGGTVSPLGSEPDTATGASTPGMVPVSVLLGMGLVCGLAYMIYRKKSKGA